VAIFGVGANYGGKRDVSDVFIRENIIGTDYSIDVAPDIHQFFRSLKAGDIVYIKTFYPVERDTIIKAIGFIVDGKIVDKSPSCEIVVSIGRKVSWLSTEEFVVPPLADWKNNVRQNALYEEFHPVVQKLVLNHLSN